jgi:hypothetical protein
MEDLIENPNHYKPRYNSDTQKYSDYLIQDISKGIVCPCFSMKVFTKRESFVSHWKSQRHKNWLAYLNENTVDYYQKSLEQEKTIYNQQKLLTQMQDELQRKDIIIKYLESVNQKCDTITID